jgi:hypothetical protein
VLADERLLDPPALAVSRFVPLVSVEIEDLDPATLAVPQVPVLLLTGPIGVGKTAVLHEADALLVAAGAGHASVELEEIARCWPDATKSSRSRLVYGNLAALWRNFAAAGASRLLLAALVEDRSELRLVSEAVPGATITVVRLHAPLPVLEKRIHRREPASTVGEIDGARWWTRHLDQVRPEDHLVETEGRAVCDVAREVLRLAGWLPESCGER